MSDGRARHFVHVSSNTSCSGGIGESEIHRKRKSMAISALKQEYDDYVRCGSEVPLDVSDSKSNTDERWADVLLEFEGPDDLFGEGIIVEVQYKNEEKDIETTTYDYLTKSFSVFWAYGKDFTTNQFRIEQMIDAFREDEETAVLAGTTQAREYAPSVEERTEQEALVSSDQGETEGIEQLPETDSNGHPVPKIPECAHGFHEITKSSGEGTNYFKCGDCDIIVHRSVRGFYFYNMDLNPRQNGPESLKSGCRGIWKQTESTYECKNCGKRYPQDHDELLSKLNVN
ncbi:hypothetical protein [Haloplanus salinarum]|uniref:hypothetical protein n=1 Tax=Haloplanus salinarum TaxID=1912324 RepID=UPI00214B8F5A|nr:hypothetical protein [Haloplanus salinarum]